MTTETRVALLVDGENLSVAHAGFAIVAAARRGTLIIKRVYGGVARVGGWATAPGFRVVHAPSGKNAGDLALSLDALELALTGQADEFVIATSDRDLALVALRLSELGCRVTGVGTEKAPEDFRKACREFVPVPPKGETPDHSTPTNGNFNERLKTFMKKEGAPPEGWVMLNALGQQRAKAMKISKGDAGIGKSGSWIDWFKKHAKEFEIEERGTQSRARLKNRMG